MHPTYDILPASNTHDGDPVASAVGHVVSSFDGDAVWHACMDGRASLKSGSDHHTRGQGSPRGGRSGTLESRTVAVHLTVPV